MENQANMKDKPFTISSSKVQKSVNIPPTWKRSIFRIDDSNSKHKIRMIGSMRSAGNYQAYVSSSKSNAKLSCNEHYKSQQVGKLSKKIYTKSKIQPFTVLIKGNANKEIAKNTRKQNKTEDMRKTDRSVGSVHEKQFQLESRKSAGQFKVLGSLKKIRSYKKIIHKNSNQFRTINPIKNEAAYFYRLEAPSNRNGQMEETDKVHHQQQTILIENVSNQIRSSGEVDDPANIHHQIRPHSQQSEEQKQSNKWPSTKIQPESSSGQSIILQKISYNTIQQPESNSNSHRSFLIKNEIDIHNLSKNDCGKTEEQTNKIKIKSYKEPTQKVQSKDKRRASQPFDDKVKVDIRNSQKDGDLQIKPKINKISRQRFQKHKENNCLLGIAKQQNQRQLEKKANLQYPGVLTTSQKQHNKNMVSLPHLVSNHKKSPYNVPMKILKSPESHKNISIPLSEISTEKQIKKNPLSNKPTVWINHPEKRSQKSRETSEIDSVREHKSEKLLQNGLSIMEPTVHCNFKSQKQITAKRTVTKIKYGRKIDGSSLNEESHSSKKKIDQKTKKQPKKKFDYLRAHSHQFSYLYPTNLNAKDEKLYERLKNLQVKLKGKQNKKEQEEYLNIMKLLLQKQA